MKSTVEYIKCHTEAEKLAAVRKYCLSQIGDLDGKISWLEAMRDSPIDYSDEIHDLKITRKRFTTMLEIIDADEHTSVMVL